jgi:hypothetical protein
MAWENTPTVENQPASAVVTPTPELSTNIEDTKMVDTVYTQPAQDGLFGGGTLGAVLLGSLLPRLTGYGAGVVGAEMAGGGAFGTNQILQAMNQQQLANSSQLITQDLGRNDRDVLASAGATQSAVASANLQQTVATLQGQTALTSGIMDSTITNAAGHTNILGAIAASAADTNNNLYNIRSGISSDIADATRVIDTDIHSMSATIERNIEGVRGDVNHARYEALSSAHAAEISAMRNAFDNQRAIYDTANDTQKLILEDGDKTRSLINANEIANLNRIILEERDRRHADNTVATLSINNNNNANATANAIAQQQQQQQIATLANGLSTVLGHINNLQQITIANGRNNTVTPSAVNV